jgi:hypothetical protein
LVGDEIDQNIRKYDTYLERIKQVGTEQAKSSDVSNVVPIAPMLQGAEIDKDLQDRFEKLQNSFKSEIELINERHEIEREILRDARAANLDSIIEYDELELQLAERHQAQLTEINRLAYQERLKMTSQALSNMSTLMNTNSRKMFEVGKAAAYSNAIVTGADAAVAAYRGGLRVSGGNPAVGAAFATASLAATGAQTQAINNTKFGGGGGGASNTQAVNNASVGTTSAGQAAPERNVFIRGIERDSLYSGEQLLDLINNELANGGRIVAA